MESSKTYKFQNMSKFCLPQNYVIFKQSVFHSAMFLNKKYIIDNNNFAKCYENVTKRNFRNHKPKQFKSLKN